MGIKLPRMEGWDTFQPSIHYFSGGKYIFENNPLFSKEFVDDWYNFTPEGKDQRFEEEMETLMGFELDEETVDSEILAKWKRQKQLEQ